MPSATMRGLDALEAAGAPERRTSPLTAAGKPRPERRRRVRLDDAVTWFLGSWPYEGPKVPTSDTVRTYSWHLKWFVSFATAHGHLHVANALTPEVIRAALQAQMAHDPRRTTNFKGGEAAAKGVALATRKLARWLLAQGMPVADLSVIKSPQPPERIQPRLRPEEFQALEAAVLHQLVEGQHASPRHAVARDLALLYLLADTGLRCGEVCSMTIDDVDFQRGTVSVWRGKGRKQRVLSIVDAEDPQDGRTLRLLADWLRARETLRNTDQHEMLWTSLHGRGLSRTALREVLASLCRAAGLSGNRPPHTFRRSSFTENYQADPRALKLLAARMGWSEKSTRMVSVYTRGAELELAATEALPSLATRWHETPRLGMPAWQHPSITRNGVGPPAGYEQRPGPAHSVKGKQEPGRLPNPRTGRRQSS